MRRQPDPAAQDGRAGPAAQLGRAIRDLRHRRGLTLVQVAGRAGLSHPFLSQLERGLAQPSMRSLHRIAQALGTTQDRLIAGGGSAGAAAAQPEVLLMRAAGGVVLPALDRGNGTGGAARQLPAGPGEFYPTEFTGLTREFGEFFEHDGSEFLYIAEGLIEVELNGPDGVPGFVLAPGDSVRYPGPVPHRWRAASDAPNRLLMVHTDGHPRRPQP
jgi:transcriptional regulator with XRE-family HTH domain